MFSNSFLFIFLQFLSKITVFLDGKIAKMTKVSSRKIVKINRTPAFYRRGYGNNKKSPLGVLLGALLGGYWCSKSISDVIKIF